jgi:hypothetical protein
MLFQEIMVGKCPRRGNAELLRTVELRGQQCGPPLAGQTRARAGAQAGAQCRGAVKVVGPRGAVPTTTRGGGRWRERSQTAVGEGHAPGGRGHAAGGVNRVGAADQPGRRRRRPTGCSCCWILSLPLLEPPGRTHVISKSGRDAVHQDVRRPRRRRGSRLWRRGTAHPPAPTAWSPCNAARQVTSAQPSRPLRVFV